MVRTAGGVGLILFPIGLVAGGVTSPRQDSGSTAGYVRFLRPRPVADRAFGRVGPPRLGRLRRFRHDEGAMGRIVSTDAAVEVTDDVWSSGWTSFWLQGPQIAPAVGIVTLIVGDRMTG